MNKKEYFEQGLRLNNRINSKISQLDELNSMATKCTSTLTGMPHNPGGSISRLEDVVGNIIDAQEDINKDIDALVNLKFEMMRVIKQVENLEYQTILEKRYLCHKKWADIASELGYCPRHLLRVHDKALQATKIPENIEPCSAD